MTEVPARTALSLVVLGALIFLGPCLWLFFFPVPFPPSVMKLVEIWYLVGGLALLVAIAACPKRPVG